MREIMNCLKSWAFNLSTTAACLTIFNISTFACQAQSSPAEAQEIEMRTTCSVECEPWPEKLGLTDEQMQKLISLRSDYEIKNAEKRAQLFANMKRMSMLMSDSNVDKSAILALNEKNNSLKAELATARTNRMIEAMSIMTDKQREQIHHNMLVHMLSRHLMGDISHHNWRKHH